MHSNVEDGWQVEDKESGLITFFKTAELNRYFVAGNLALKNTGYIPIKRTSENQLIEEVLAEMDAMTLHEINTKRDFIDHFHKQYPGSCTLKKIKNEIDRYWQVEKMGKKPSASTAYRWMLKYKKSGGDIMSLLKQESSRGGRTHRLNKTTIDLCHSVIHQYYLNRNRITVKRAYEYLLVAIDRENRMRVTSEKHYTPSMSTLRRLIDELNAYDVMKSRYGKDYADMHFHVVQDQTPASQVNDRWEIDHTPMDVIAIDDIYGYVIGRPYLTVIIDVYTRCIMSAYVSFEELTTRRSLNAMKEAILPKDNIHKEYPSLQNEWPCYGLPDLVFSDRGMDFLSNIFRQFCNALSIHRGKAKRKRGSDKGTIERGAGIINRMVTHELPGKTFSSIQEKGHGYNPSKFAKIPLSGIKQAVYECVVDVYHQSFHSTIGMSPIDKWKQEVVTRSLRLPLSAEQIDVNICIKNTRKLTNRGVEINNLSYSSKDLERLIKSIGYQKVTFRWNPENLGHIYLCLDGGGYLKVPLKKEYFEYGNGLSLKVHNIIKQSMPKGNTAEQALYLAKRKDQIHQAVMQKSSSRKTLLGKKDLHLLTSLEGTNTGEVSSDTQIDDLPTLDDFYSDDDLPDLGVQ